MILTKKEILLAIGKKEITISPLNKRNIGPASIDLTLSDEFRFFPRSYTIHLSEATDAEKLTQKQKQKEIILRPEEFTLAKTKEKISLPEDICGFISGRSRFARLGLVVDMTAFFVQPGVSNHQVLEIKNLSRNNIILRPGVRIAQLILARTEGKAKYLGKFRHQ